MMDASDFFFSCFNVSSFQRSEPICHVKCWFLLYILLNQKCCCSSVDGWKISGCRQRRAKGIVDAS
jgi:hypothetical protein